VKSKEWYLHKSTEVVTNWTVLEDKFISQFCPQGKVQDVMTAIPMFYHRAVETLSEAREGYKSMLIK
jgi:hypothetical protein